MAPSTADAETILSFLDYANMVLDDVMSHPYWKKGVEIPYYNHQTEVRDVPDTIMQTGILAKMAVDKQSVKAQRYEADYYNRLNQVMARIKFGVGAQFELTAVDYGTTPSSGTRGVY